MPEAPRIREFADTDIGEVLDVLRAALGEPPGLRRTPELFEWKHLANPFGRSVMLVAILDGQIAGFRAFMRWDLVTPSGAVVRCGRAVDTATHPGFQRRGVFRALTESALEVASDHGVDLIFNTPNSKSGAGYLKMGWHEVGPIGVMVRPRLGMIRGGRTAWPHDVGATSARDALDGGTVLGAFGRPAAGLRTVRTEQYLRWRFTDHPTARYVVAGDGNGAAIGRLGMRNGRRELVVSELGGEQASQTARSLVAASKPDYAVAWFSAGSPERALAIRAGLLPVPRVSALTLVARPLGSLDIDTSTPAAWDLALGDLELL